MRCMYSCTGDFHCCHHHSGWFIAFVVILIIFALFDAVMKVIAMWRAARNNHLAWFICIALFNTIGILPIIYLSFHKKVGEQER